jgi:nucleoside-diphosphate-sugar epimerase
MLRTLTGFTPKIALEDGVAETFAWYRDVWPRTERR